LFTWNSLCWWPCSDTFQECACRNMGKPRGTRPGLAEGPEACTCVRVLTWDAQILQLLHIAACVAASISTGGQVSQIVVAELCSRRRCQEAPQVMVVMVQAAGGWWCGRGAVCPRRRDTRVAGNILVGTVHIAVPGRRHANPAIASTALTLPGDAHSYIVRALQRRRNDGEGEFLGPQQFQNQWNKYDPHTAASDQVQSRMKLNSYRSHQYQTGQCRCKILDQR
jgi:hypothetical protein